MVKFHTSKLQKISEITKHFLDYFSNKQPNKIATNDRTKYSIIKFISAFAARKFANIKQILYLCSVITKKIIKL